LRVEGDLFLIRESLLGDLRVLCGPKKPPKKPHGVRAYTSEPETSVPGAARESNHGKVGKYGKEEAGQMADDK
jgi:hypothetical protein